MKRIFCAILLVVLYGCGSQASIAEDNPNPPGLHVDSTLIRILRKQFEQTKACTGLEKGDFDSLAIVIMPDKFRCRWYDGYCSGLFVPPNTIRLGKKLSWRHEVIHYLLYVNKNEVDYFHESRFFKECS